MFDQLIQSIKDFAKASLFNILTVLPAFFVALELDVRKSESMFSDLMAQILVVFMVVWILQSAFMVVIRTHRHWVNSLVAMIILLLAGWLTLIVVSDPDFHIDYTEQEFALVLNIGTEFLGAAAIVILLQLRRIGVAGAMVLGVIFIHLIDSSTGFDADMYINLASEIFGALLTGWVIHRVIDRRDIVPEKLKVDSAEG